MSFITTPLGTDRASAILWIPTTVPEGIVVNLILHLRDEGVTAICRDGLGAWTKSWGSPDEAGEWIATMAKGPVQRLDRLPLNAGKAAPDPRYFEAVTYDPATH